MCVLYLYFQEQLLPPPEHRSPEEYYTRNMQNTTVREGTVEVPASPKQDTEAGTISHKHITSLILEL